MTLKHFALLMLAMGCVSVGEMCLKIGADQIGEISVKSLPELVRIPLIVLKSKWFALGIPLMGVYFYSFLSLLSRADLSFVLPLTSISFITGTLLAKYVLKEEVNVTRWIGTVVIVLGVALVASGEAKTEKSKQQKQQAWQSLPTSLSAQ